MIIYPDTDKELAFDDYKKLPGLHDLQLSDLYSLQSNIENAIDNAYIYHSELLAMLLDTDLRKVNLYIRMREKQRGRE